MAVHADCPRAVFDFIPTYCPNCGRYLNLKGCEVIDFQGYCSFGCECGLHYQRAKPELVLEAAVKSGGDAGQYWQ